MENPHFSFFVVLLLFSFIVTPLLYIHTAMVQLSLQAFPVVTATDTTNAMRAWALLMRVCVLRVRACASVRGAVHMCWYMEKVLALLLVRFFGVGIDT